MFINEFEKALSAEFFIPEDKDHTIRYLSVLRPLHRFSCCFSCCNILINGYTWPVRRAWMLFKELAKADVGGILEDLRNVIL